MSNIYTSCDVEDVLAGNEDCLIDWDNTGHAPKNHEKESFRFLGFHNVPRFGRTRDITGDWQDYRQGLTAMSIAGLALLSLWLAVIGYCRWKRAFGVLAGVPPCAPIQRNLKPNEEDGNTIESGAPKETTKISMNDSDSDKPFRSLATFNKQVKICRPIVFVSGLLVWVFSGLLIGNAFRSLDQVLDVAVDTLPHIDEILTDAGDATEALVLATAETKLARAQFFDNITNHCCFGNDRWNQGCRFRLPLPFLGGTAEDAVVRLNETIDSTFTFNEKVSVIATTIRDIQGLLASMDDAIDHVQYWWLYVASALVLLLDVIVLLFLIGIGLRCGNHERPRMILPWLQFVDKINSWTLPVFICTMFLTYIFSMVCLVSSQLLGDFCTGDPDKTVERIIDAPGVVSPLITWYLADGCSYDLRPELVPDVARSFVPLIRRITAFGTAWLNMTSTDPGDYSRHLQILQGDYCGFELNLVQRSLTLLHVKFVNLLELGLGLLKTLRCDRVHILYTKVVHELACDKGLTATANVFIYLFLVSLFSMIMITFRVAWQPEQVESHLDNEDNTNKEDLDDRSEVESQATEDVE